MSRNTNTDIWIAGAFAAFSVDLLVYPLDTIKTRLQSPDYKRLYLHHATNTVNKAALFRGMYQGLGSVIVATLPSSGAFFTTYEAVKHVGLTYNPNGLLPVPIIHSLASGTAELVSCAILTPAEVIKQNAQMVSRDASSSSSGATVQTLRKFKNNPFGLWRGYGALAGRNLPYTALTFPMYERFKQEIIKWRKEKVGHDRSASQVPLLEHGLVTGIASGTAGAIAAVVTTPIDVVKTRIMLSAATSFANQDAGDLAKKAASKAREGKVVDALGTFVAEGGPGKKKQSSWAIGKEIIRDNGWKGLMRGGALRAGWTWLGAGLYLGVYESGRLYLERGREQEKAY